MPNRRMSPLSVTVACVDDGGKKGMFGAKQGAEWGFKMGQLILRPVRVEVRSLVQRATTPSKRAFLYFINFTTHELHLCMSNNSPCI